MTDTTNSTDRTNRTNSLPTENPPAEEGVSTLATLSWLRDDRIVVFTVNGPTTRPAVDRWFDLVAGVVKSWPPEKPYLALHDLSNKQVALTPYARSRAMEFDPLVRHLHGRIAIVLPNTFMNQLFRLFLRTLGWQRKLPTEAFTAFDAALRWLESGLQQEQQS